MCIVQGIIDHLCLFSEFHKAHIPQYPQLMRNRGHAHAKDAGNIAHAEFFTGQGIDYLGTGRISQDAEGL